MADKIVQLTDKNSNNLYPISGSSLADSVSSGAIVDGAVTTAKIADGDVTQEKIDWPNIARVYKPLSTTNATSTSSSYNYVQFSPKIEIVVPTVIGADYIVRMHGTWKTDKTSSQNIIAAWADGTRMAGASGAATVNTNWQDGELMVGYFTATSTSTTISFRYGAGGTSVTMTVVNNVVVEVRRVTIVS